ncbi:hypothetical protein K501DRAFT_289166 [Backusella circina FSU 941]|nr:hypothetical protein K501DRAFT_289166 [Backusella circina FSU 941]
MMANCFNSEHTLLQSSLADDKILNQPQSYFEHQDGPPAFEVAQNLAPELYRYEFPPKSRISALGGQENLNDEFSFFEESSFTTASTSTAAYSSTMHTFDENDDIEEEEEEDYYNETMEYLSRNSHNNTFNNTDRLNRYFDSFSNESIENWSNLLHQQVSASNNLNLYVDDEHLSPLQLPSQIKKHAYDMNDSRCIREESYDSVNTVTFAKKVSGEAVGPASFLSPTHEPTLECVNEEDGRIDWDSNPFTFPEQSLDNDWDYKASRTVHPYTCRMGSEDDIDFSLFQNRGVDTFSDDLSHCSLNSKVVIMKLSKTQPLAPKVIQCSQYGGYYGYGSDEGYDDGEELNGKELSIESSSAYLPLSVKEQNEPTDLDHLRHAAVTRIQALWRGYSARKQFTTSALKPSHRVLAGLVRIREGMHSREEDKLRHEIRVLEQRVNEETAMRIAFEKAMEDMTVLVDQQHKILHERVEQEISMRQVYESKMEHALSQIQPLESRLRHEAKARADMESMMSRIIDQLHSVKAQAKEDAEARKSLQKKLDSTLEELSVLKKRNTTPSTPRTRPSTLSTTQNVRPASRLSNTAKITRSPTIAPAAKPTPKSLKRTIVPSSPSRVTPKSRTESVKKPTTTVQATPLRKTILNRKTQ